jgi:hypothetical protein
VLYVAGEILLWMLLAFALGIAAGWLIWGLRSRTEDQQSATERQQAATLRDEAGRLRAQNDELLALHARDAATIAHLQQSAGGDTAPLITRMRELEGELGAATRDADLLRQRLFELEQAERAAPTAPVSALGPDAAPPDHAEPDHAEPDLAETARVEAARAEAEAAERQRLQADLDALRTRVGELGRAFGGQLDLGDPAAVRVRWSALQARAAESDQLARQLDGLRAVLGGQLDPAELEARFSDLEERANEADALRARLAQLEHPSGDSS